MAVKIAKKIKKNGHNIDMKSVSIGAILHDIGRAKTHGTEHGVVGAEMLRKMGLGKFAKFAETHLGAGIPAAEARELGLPAKDFMPRTLEEKIVTYADKRISRNREISYEEAIRWFKTELGKDHPSLERFEALHSKIQKLMG